MHPLLELPAGASREEIEAACPDDAELRWDEQRQKLTCFLDDFGPFPKVEAELENGGLSVLRFTVVHTGEFEVLEQLSFELAELVAPVELRQKDRPWDPTAVRTQLENKGGEKISVALMLDGMAPGRGKLFGKAVAFKPKGVQGYGFEIGWRPEARRAAAPATKEILDHPCLRMDVPEGFVSIDVPQLFAAYEHPRTYEALRVTLVAFDSDDPAQDTLKLAIENHARVLEKNHARFDASPACFLPTGAVHEASRDYYVQAEGPPWNVRTRYAVTHDRIMVRGWAKPQRALIQITAYFSAWAPNEALARALDGARFVPGLAGAVRAPSPTESALVPYVLHSNTVRQRDAMLLQAGGKPEGSAGLAGLGHDLYLTVAQDLPEQVRPLFPADIPEELGSLARALDTARRNLGARLSKGELSLRLHSVPRYTVMPVWQEGMHAVVADEPQIKVLVVGPGWLAASVLALPDLWQRASALGDELRVLCLHRDRIFVFPDLGGDENRRFAASIARREAAFAQRPLSEQLFRLDARGLSPIAE